jgi:hypothetical protein
MALPNVRRYDVLIAHANGMSLSEIADVMSTTLSSIKELYLGKTVFAEQPVDIMRLQELETSPADGTIERIFVDRVANVSSKWYDPSLAETFRLRGFYNKVDRLARIASKSTNVEVLI